MQLAWLLYYCIIHPAIYIRGGLQATSAIVYHNQHVCIYYMKNVVLIKDADLMAHHVELKNALWM